MSRKFVLCITTLIILSITVSGVALANQPELPTWEVVLDPSPYVAADAEGYFIHDVEQFKDDLYAVVAGAWFWWPGYPGRLLRSPDGKNWEPVTDLGFGLGAVDTPSYTQNYYETTWDLIVFHDQLYMAPHDSQYERPGVVLRSPDGTTWETVFDTSELGFTWYDVRYGQLHKFVAFEGMLYANISFYDVEAEFTASAVIRSPNGDPGTWETVKIFPNWSGPGTFQVYKGALYLGSDGVYSPPDWAIAPDQIWRTFDGVNWEMVVGDGFGNPGGAGMGGFAEYKGYLYVGAGNGVDENGEGGNGQVWRTQDGLQWENVITNGFGNPLDYKFDGLVVYAGQLYTFTVNWTEGCLVYRTQDGVNWEAANERGWGNPLYATSHHTSDQVVFKDELYMGVVGPNGVLLKMVHPDQ